MTDHTLTLSISDKQLASVREIAPDGSIMLMRDGGYAITNPEAVKAVLPDSATVTDIKEKQG